LRPRDAQVIERLLQEFEHLLLAVGGENEVRVLLVELPEPLLILLQLEEIVRLHDFGDLAENLRPGAVGQPVLLLEELLLARRVEAPVFGLVDLALVEELLEDGAHDLLCRGSVVRMKSSLEMLSLGSSARNSALTSSTNCCGGMPRFPGARLHLLAVLVHTGQKMHLSPICRRKRAMTSVSTFS
jgi:hypothetical protein